MTNIHSDLAKETGSFFKIAWELLINAVCGKWGELKAILPNGDKAVTRVKKGTFTHCFKIENWEGGSATYTIDERGADLMAMVIADDGTTKCFEGVGKVEITSALEAQKSYFVVVFGVI